MANLVIDWTAANTTGTTGYKVMYRLYGTSLWTSYITSGTVGFVSPALDNRIYDIQIVNLSESQNNPTSAISQGIGFTDPLPVISPINTSVGYYFNNLSQDINTYTTTVSAYDTPGQIIATHILSPTSVITDSFSGLVPRTKYYLTITPAANQFSKLYSYVFTTEEVAQCGTPQNAIASITSGNVITVSWVSPGSYPADGFLLSYRRKGDTTYTTFTTSGTTSGNTQTILLSAPASYEGTVQSVCTGDLLSVAAPFGTNSYEPLKISVSDISVTNPTFYQGRLSSAFPNPYDTYISGSFIAITSSGTTLIPYTSVLYSAGSILELVTLPGTPPPSNQAPATISNVTISSIVPAFDNGGALQQFDNLYTPSYFSFYSGLTSGVTWAGNPCKLPSFTLDKFTVTEVDVNNNVLAGIIQMSWIYDSLYMAGVIPYDTLTFTVKDPSGNVTMGSTTVSTSPIGLRTTTIPITLQNTPILASNSFNMVSSWSDSTILDTLSFYLPLF